MLVSIVVPSYREAENLPYLIDRVAQAAQASGLRLEMIVVDDDSRDGSVEIVTSRPEPWVRIVVRTENRGLSPAVLDGLRQARGDVLVCMDADLSHPPEAVPAMLAKLEAGADFVIGSRYAPGGSTSHDWGFLRWLNSRLATVLARPLTHASDPMAGFFALRRSTFEGGRDFNPVGYKIGLELIVKCRCERVVEIPIHFEDRRFGVSKLTLKQQLLYLKHLWRLYTFKYGVWSQLVQFLAVGGMGTAANLLLLTALLLARTPLKLAVAIAILGSMCFNFALYRRFGSSVARTSPWPGRFVHFVLASSAAAVVNYLVTILTLGRFPGFPPQLAALVGIAAGAAVNFVASRYLAFKATHVRVRPRSS